MNKIKVKSLYDIAIEKKITNTFEFLKLIQGKRLKTIPSTTNHLSGHNLSKKFIFPLTGTAGWTNGVLNPQGNTVIQNAESGKGACYMSELAFDISTLKELEDELAELNDWYSKNKNSLESKIELLKELGLSEYDEKIIKVVQLMDVFEPKKGAKYNKLEQAQKFVEALES